MQTTRDKLEITIRFPQPDFGVIMIGGEAVMSYDYEEARYHLPTPTSIEQAMRTYGAGLIRGLHLGRSLAIKALQDNAPWHSGKLG